MNLISILLVTKKPYLKIIFFLSFFLFSCSSEKSTQEKAEAFLKELLFNEHGCFTLFGSKAITTPIYLLLDIRIVDKKIKILKTHENFKAWKKFSKNMNFSNFFFVEYPISYSFIDTYNFVCFVNIRETKNIYEKNKDLFFKTTNIASWEALLYELKKPNRKVWKSIFSNHYLSGLLHGFGEQNASSFCRYYSEKFPRTWSEIFEGPITQEHFPIPIFASFEHPDEAVEKFKKERTHIQEIYRNGNMMEITLKALKETPSF
jgi:hypothetical protein